MDAKELDALLRALGMHPDCCGFADCEKSFYDGMDAGLAGHSTGMMMLPTYISAEGTVPRGEKILVMDAGGTNFRRAVAWFDESGKLVLDHFEKRPMPGTRGELSVEEFFDEIAEALLPVLAESDRIGFCFSYTAEVTPDIDGRVVRIDKEVTVRGCEGQLVGASLIKELERRGIHGKSAVILNDTVAVLLGGSAVLDKTAYSGFFGQVSGTGTNTCCAVPYAAIKKLHRSEPGEILVNLESGLYSGMPRGKFDLMLDEMSKDPGHKFFEKMTAGVYLGELTRLMLVQAAEDKLLSAPCAAKVAARQQAMARKGDDTAAVAQPVQRRDRIGHG